MTVVGQQIPVKEYVTLIIDDLIVCQWGIQLTLVKIQRALKPHRIWSWPGITVCAETANLLNCLKQEVVAK